MNRLDSISDIEHLADESIADIYDAAVEHFDSGIFIELGCYTGGSTIYLAQQILEAKKDIVIYAVDTWQNIFEIEGEPYEGSQFPVFWDNVKKYKCERVIYPVMLDSRKASLAFNNNSVDFVFVDADHSYECAKADITNWLPKIKEQGWIGGHDYNQEVEKAVHDVFQDYMNLLVQKFDQGCCSFLVDLS